MTEVERDPRDLFWAHERGLEPGGQASLWDRKRIAYPGTPAARQRDCICPSWDAVPPRQARDEKWPFIAFGCRLHDLEWTTRSAAQLARGRRWQRAAREWR